MSRYRVMESQIQEAILKDGIAYINVWATDCDRCSTEYSQTFTNMKDYQEWDERFWDSAEGSQGYDVTDKDNLCESATYGSGVDGWEDMFSR